MLSKLHFRHSIASCLVCFCSDKYKKTPSKQSHIRNIARIRPTRSSGVSFLNESAVLNEFAGVNDSMTYSCFVPD